MRQANKFMQGYFGNAPLVGVEIGVCNGDHAQQILEAVNIKSLHLIDIWAPYRQFGKVYTLEKYYQSVITKFGSDKRIHILKLDSLQAAPLFEDESLDFVYLDACHEERAVASEILAWWFKIKIGGVLSGHDYHSGAPFPELIGVDVAVDVCGRILKRSIQSFPDIDIHYNTDWWIIK